MSWAHPDTAEGSRHVGGTRCLSPTTDGRVRGCAWVCTCPMLLSHPCVSISFHCECPFPIFFLELKMTSWKPVSFLYASLSHFTSSIRRALKCHNSLRLLLYYHRLSGWNNRSLFLTIWSLEAPGPSASSNESSRLGVQEAALLCPHMALLWCVHLEREIFLFL